MTSQDLEQLPQATRTYQGLVGQLAGVLPPVASSGGTNNPIRSMVVQANGTSASGTNVSIDGVSADQSMGPVLFHRRSVHRGDQTVNVVTASSGADQGAVNGAGIHVQIKSGTNSFHGSGYEYSRTTRSRLSPISSLPEIRSKNTSITILAGPSAAR